MVKAYGCTSTSARVIRFIKEDFPDNCKRIQYVRNTNYYSKVFSFVCEKRASRPLETAYGISMIIMNEGIHASVFLSIK